MKEVKLSDGFTLELADDIMNNMELVDALAEMTNDSDVLTVSKVSRLILGHDNRKLLYNHLRTEDGRVPVEKVSAAIKEIFAAYKDGKN